MKRVVLPIAVLSGAVLVSACNGEVVVLAEREQPVVNGEGTEIAPIRDLEVRLVPFDRDAVFDSLTRAHDVPEPVIPEDLLEMQRLVMTAQEELAAAESRWNQVRDQLRQTLAELERLDRADPRYVILFREFSGLEREEEDLSRRMSQAADQATEIRREFLTRAEEIRLLREQWEDDAYRDVVQAFAEREEELRREILVERTDPAGRVRFSAKPGRWWVHARVEMPFYEYYWNIPVEVERGEPVEIRLNPETAERRMTL